MGLKQDLEIIRTQTAQILDECNAVAKLAPADTLADTPRLITEAEGFGRSEGEQSGYEAGYGVGYGNGKLLQYEEFWEAFQDGGKRTDYSGEFEKPYWDDVTFKPKYPIVIVGNANQAFYNCGATVFSVALDTSRATGMNYFCCRSKFKALPAVDFRGVSPTTTISLALYNCPDLASVEKVYLHGGPLSDCFKALPALVEIRLDGELVTSVDLSGSTKLSGASVDSVVAALSDTVTGKTLTLSQAAVNAAFTTEEWETLAATKPNWTITLSA